MRACGEAPSAWRWRACGATMTCCSPCANSSTVPWPSTSAAQARRAPRAPRNLRATSAACPAPLTPLESRPRRRATVVTRSRCDHTRRCSTRCSVQPNDISDFVFYRDLQSRRTQRNLEELPLDSNRGENVLK